MVSAETPRCRAANLDTPVSVTRNTILDGWIDGCTDTNTDTDTDRQMGRQTDQSPHSISSSCQRQSRARNYKLVGVSLLMNGGLKLYILITDS